MYPPSGRGTHAQSQHHIAMICSDYPGSKRFYVEILGCEIVREVYREERKSFKLDLQVGDQYQIELFSFPNPAELGEPVPRRAVGAILRSK